MLPAMAAAIDLFHEYEWVIIQELAITRRFMSVRKEFSGIKRDFICVTRATEPSWIHPLKKKKMFIYN